MSKRILPQVGHLQRL